MTTDLLRIAQTPPVIGGGARTLCVRVTAGMVLGHAPKMENSMTHTLAGFSTITVDPEVMMGQPRTWGHEVKIDATLAMLLMGGLDDTLF